jgi:hypothetical protein
LNSYNISFTPSEHWFQKIENLDISYNNFTNFTLIESFPRLNKLNLEHNRISSIVINIPALYLEYMNLSNNQLENISNIKILTNLKFLDLSFNRLESLNTIIKPLNSLIFLEELNLTQNCFNKDFVTIVNQTIDCVSKLGKQPDFEGFMNYRGYVFKNIRSRIKILDNIIISEYETEHLNGLKFDRIESNSSKFQGIENDANRKSKEKLDESFRSKKSNKSLRKDPSLNVINKREEELNENQIIKVSSTRNINKDILTEENSQGITNQILLKKENSFINSYKENKPHIPLPQKNTGFRVKQSISRINEKYRNVYAILKKTIAKLADPNGFIDIFNLKLFFSDLKKYYRSIDNLDYIITEADKASDQSIFPNKVHINDFSKIMKTDKFSSVYEALLFTINNKNSGGNNNQSFRNSSRQSSRRESKNNVTEGLNNINNIYQSSNRKKGERNNDNNSIPFELRNNDLKYDYGDPGLRNQLNNYQLEQNKYNNFHTNKTQTGFLKRTFENNTQNTCVRDKIKTVSKFKTPHLKNKEILKGGKTCYSKEDIHDSFFFSSFYQKESELISNEDLLISLIQCVRIPLFPLKYCQYNNLFTYKLSEKHKEYKLLNNFFRQFNLTLINSLKYFCLEKQEKYFSSKETEITEALLLFDTPDVEIESKFESKGNLENPLCLFDNPLKVSEKIKYNLFNIL